MCVCVFFFNFLNYTFEPTLAWISAKQWKSNVQLDVLKWELLPTGYSYYHFLYCDCYTFVALRSPLPAAGIFAANTAGVSTVTFLLSLIVITYVDTLHHCCCQNY